MKFKATLMATGLAMAGIAFAGSAGAATIPFSFGTEFSGAQSTANNPFLNVEISDNGAGGVTISSTFNALSGTEYLEGLYFNIEPFVAGLTCSGATAGATCQFGSDLFKADGHPYDFDLLISFPTANANRFVAGDSFTLTIAGVGASAFAAQAEGQGYYAVARVRSIGADGEGSGWFYDEGCCEEDELPEPGSLALLGLGLLGLGLTRRRVAHQ